MNYTFKKSVKGETYFSADCGIPSSSALSLPFAGWIVSRLPPEWITVCPPAPSHYWCLLFHISFGFLQSRPWSKDLYTHSSVVFLCSVCSLFCFGSRKVRQGRKKIVKGVPSQHHCLHSHTCISVKTHSSHLSSSTFILPLFSQHWHTRDRHHGLDLQTELLA